MIKNVIINGLFDSKGSIDLEMKDNLFILTGDNGSGKTTILNMVYDAISGNFEWFFNRKFKEMQMKFQTS